MPSNEEEFELNFPAHAKGKKNDDGTWTATITRKIDDKTFPVAVLKNITSAECYTRLGAKVPTNEVSLEEGLEAAQKVLSDALNSFKGRSLLNPNEVQDVFLDAMNALGWKDERS